MPIWRQCKGEQALPLLQGHAAVLNVGMQRVPRHGDEQICGAVRERVRYCVLQIHTTLTDTHSLLAR